ncbi:jasmonate-induced protein homolog [Chenopodium quinoa]|uniref:jasmonate-induced protein homolog n=1 Tax=Chenopodium quinoa TaxID=63459 RepID=UPI000B77FE44|nr:jasmonate-induced protein homolog [Chenopodium quinoa]XP_021769333.1 jasmonate-induced protein homolog [Chenopodium quinoa]XP_021769335.1 jasmonate-induced protein homolog [Chenopodium quinoa]
MASIQCERKEKVAVQLSCEQKATLDELIKCAEKSLVSEDIAKKSRAIVAEKECLNKADADAARLSAVAGALTNQTSKGSLTVFNSKQWKGYTVSDYSDPLESLGSFAQAALFGGVKAAVVYVGKNSAGLECGWLLAWSDTDGRKAYADCGPISKFNNINWNQIEAKLNESGFIAYANDSGTGTSMYATIVGHSAGSAVAVAYTG